MEQKDRLILELKKYGVLRNVEIELIKKNTNSIMTLHSSRIIIIKGKQYVLSIIKDVSILKKYENKLRKSEELHRLLADNVSDMIWTINLDGELTYISPSVKRLLGFSVKEIMNQNISRTFSDKSFVYINQVLYDANICFDNNKPFKPFRKDIEQISKDGSTIWTDLTISGIYDNQDQFVGLVGVSKDISEKKKMEEEIIKLSITDKLTQIYNRVKLDETLNNELLRSKRNGVPSSIILLDIDKFKLVNDNYGHQVGDSVLVEFANVLKKHIRGIDTLGRWGGEEFLIILPGTNLDGAVNLAEKLRECVSAYHFSVAGHITASFGVAISVNNIETELIFRVDQALYLAKSNGRDRVEVVL
jgi:diguanylate cyclase (GGDEF)-like protein/PAS domain S-box-containing protein